MAIGKSFMQNQIKSRKYFSAQKSLALNICDGAKQIYSKKQKKILRKDR